MRIIISAVILFCIEFSFGQGMKFDQDSFVSTPKIDQTRSAVYSSYSLERYAPTPYPQSGGTLVSHAFTNARTILFAKELRTTNAEDIALLMFSPYHFYYENKNVTDYDCSDGLDFDKAAKYALNYGFCPLVNVEYKYYYPFSDHELCPTAKYPTNLVSNRSTSMKYRPDNDVFFQQVNANIENQLTGASTYKIGGEFLSGDWSFRGGYKFIESPYKNDAILSDRSGYSLGLGYALGNARIDLAYDWAKQQSNTALYDGAFANTAYIDTINTNIVASLSFQL